MFSCPALCAIVCQCSQCFPAVLVATPLVDHLYKLYSIGPLKRKNESQALPTANSKRGRNPYPLFTADSAWLSP